MKNRYYKLISALIAIAMLVCSIPMSATASDISLDAGVTEAFKPVYNDSALKKELREKKGLGVVEIESLRSEYAKHYQKIYLKKFLMIIQKEVTQHLIVKQRYMLGRMNS